MQYRSLLALPFLFAACVGEDPVVSGNDAAPGVDATADGTANDSSANDSSANDSSVPDASVNDATPQPDASSDAAVEAEAGTPTTTCIDQVFINGTGNHVGCQANASAVTPGGKLAVGDYSNSSLYGQPYCPIAYAIGNASVFVDNGETFFRYYVTRKTSTQDPGTTLRGTYWVKSNDGSGPIELVEICDLANKGKSRVGTLAVVGSVYTLTFATGQEKWTHF